jgi:hypothetical protein
MTLAIRVDNGVIDSAFYRYDPSMASTIVLIVLSTVTTFYHAFQLLKTRTWVFIPFVIGGICE